MRHRMEVTVEQRQKLTLTPELKQSIEILRFSLDDLARFIREQSLENPMMELEEPDMALSMEVRAETDLQREELLALADHFQDTGAYSPGAYPRSEEEFSFLDFSAKSETFQEDLLFQLRTQPSATGLLPVAEGIVAHLDDNGYLRIPLSRIAEDHTVSETRAEEALQLVQSLVPRGVGARDLAECLLLQLSSEDKIPRFLVQNHLEDIGANRLEAIATELNIDMEALLDAVQRIKSLNPKPGASFADNQPVKYIVPDATIEKTEAGYEIIMHDDYVPTIHISEVYLRMIRTGDDETVRFLSEKLQSAQQLISGVGQRKSTIHRVLEVIVRTQKDFLDKGERHLAPMSQKEVARELDLHESTVSRATTEKYVYTPRGLFELKFFFSTEMKTDDGDDVSSRAIKAMIREIVDEEDKKKPLSDAKITEWLIGEGIEISRKTVAKYREAMGIPKSSMRKTFR